VSDLAVDWFQGKAFNAATLTVAVIGLIIATYAAYYARAALFPPRKRLHVLVKSPTSLLSSDSTLISGIEVKRNGETLTDPFIVDISLKATGRHDIGSVDFDQGRPLSFSLGATTLADVLEVTRHPEDGNVPDYTITEDSRIQIGPDLLKRGTRIDLRMLVDGAPEVSLDAHLMNTEVRLDENPEVEVNQPPLKVWRTGFIAVVIMFTLTVTYSVHALRELSASTDPLAKAFQSDLTVTSYPITSDKPPKGLTKALLHISGSNYYPDSPVLVAITCSGVEAIVYDVDVDKCGDFSANMQVGPLSRNARCNVAANQIKPGPGIAVANVTIT
jgi:hypothetical protein